MQNYGRGKWLDKNRAHWNKALESEEVRPAKVRITVWYILQGLWWYLRTNLLLKEKPALKLEQTEKSELEKASRTGKSSPEVQAVRCKEKIPYYSKILNQNASKAILEMRKGNTGRFNIWTSLAICGAAHHAVMVFQSPGCLFALIPATSHTTHTHNTANRYFKLTGTSEEFGCGIYLTTEPWVYLCLNNPRQK